MPPFYIGRNPFSGLGNSGQPQIGTPPGPLPSPARTGPNPGDVSPQPAPPNPANVLSPQAVRATGPSKGYDASYLQNLATAIGGLFSNSKQGGNTMSFNPLGNLSEISPSSGLEGNAPLPGLPQTWLQNALQGLGFTGATPPAPTATPVAPQAPNVSPGGVGGGRGILGPFLRANQ